jgi:uncharacterized membrane protein
MPHSARGHDRLLAVLGLVVGAGAALRLLGLNAQSLWNDELSSWARSSFSNLGDVISLGAAPDVHPPGYYVILFFSQHIWGETELALRLPSALAGVLCIPLIYQLGRRLYSRPAGLYAATLLACLWAPLYYSQEARAYSLLLLGTLLSAGVLLDWLEALTVRSPRTLVLGVTYVAVAVFTIYLHYYGLLLIWLQGVFAFLWARRHWRYSLAVATVWGIVGLAYLPWLPVMATQFTDPREAWIPRPTAFALIAYLRFFFNDSNRPAVLIAGVVVLAILSWLINGWHSSQSGMRWIGKSTRLLLAWLFVPFTIPYFVSLVYSPVLTNRNLIIALPAAYLLLGRAITLLSARFKYQSIAFGSVLLYFLWDLFFVYRYYAEPQKEQFREAAGYVVQQSARYPGALVIGHVWSEQYLEYYFRRFGSTQRVSWLAGLPEDIARTGAFLQQYPADYVWFVRAHRSVAPEFLAFLNDALVLVEHQPFVGADVWLYRNKP